MAANFRVSVDVGGTFTDLVYLKSLENGDKSINISKAHTTPPNFEKGILTVLENENIELPHVKYFVHGSTIIINALTERKGEKTGLITSYGFRDILEIARGNRPDFFNLDYIKPPPLIPRFLRKELKGRISYKGEELVPLDLTPLPEILNDFEKESVKSIAICLLNSYANPIHEIQILNEIKKIAPGFQCLASYQISKEWREYERTNTTSFCAYVRPVAQNYLDNLQKILASKNYQSPFYLMQSNCGVDTIETSKEIPLGMVESGPASGMWAVQELGQLVGEKNLIGLDIGGTTAKCSLLKDGHIKINSDYYIEKTEKYAGYPLIIPVVDILEIGNGGGSIAWLDQSQKLKVGPISAGAFPGPIAYNQGGNEPTTTDANLILNRINKKYFCGGKMNVEIEQLLEKRFTEFGEKISMNSQELARSIIAVANQNMSNAIKLISVNRGYDPRDFVLVAFGGGGGLHAAYLVKELGIKKFIIPRFSGVFSSWGMLTSDVRRDYFQTVLISFDNKEACSIINRSLKSMEEQAKETFTKEGFSKYQQQFKRFANIRYENQGHSIEIELPEGEIHEEKLKEIQKNFYSNYQREFTYILADNPVEIVCFHFIAIVIIPDKLSMHTLDPENFKENPIKEQRKVDYSEYGICESVIYDGDKIGPNSEFHGPAIIEERTTTIVIPPNFLCKTDSYGNYHITIPTNKDKMETQVLNQRITYEIIENAFQAIASEMFLAIKHTAMSTIIYEVVDMGTALTDSKGNLASSGCGIPAFVGALDKSVQKILDIYQKDIEAGDIFILNDPYSGGITHLNDFIVACPIFYGEELVAWSANIAHWNDVSGKNQGSMSPDANEIFQEGIIIPPVKLFQKKIKNSNVFSILKANSRMPDFQEGDLWSQIAAVRVGENRVIELIQKYSLQTFFEAIDYSFKSSEQATQRALEKLPHNTFEFSELQENGLTFNLKLIINSNEFIIDLRENPDQLKTPFNCTRDTSLIPAQLIFKSLTSPNSPLCNAGTFKPLKVLTRKGSIFDAKHPAPQSFYYETMVRLYDLIWHAFCEKLNVFLPAGHFASICGTIIGGIHPDTGKSYSIIEPEIGGWGGSANKDGNCAIFSGLHGETFNCPAEISEARNGLFVECLKFNEDQGGEGEKRGGKGICMRYVIRGDNAFVIASYTRSKIFPWGVKGGRNGSGNYLKIIKDGGKDQKIVAEITDFSLKKGDIIEVVTGNGGGWGEPKKRDRKLVEEDIKNEIISVELAGEIYGV